MSLWILLQKETDFVLPGSSLHALLLHQCWVLIQPLMWASLMILSAKNIASLGSFLQGKWLKWAFGRRARRIPEGRQENSASRTRETTAAAAQTALSVLGVVPLGFSSIRPSWWWCCCERCWCLELLLPSFCCIVLRGFKVNMELDLQKVQLEMASILRAHVFCSSYIYSLPKALFWVDCLHGSEKNNTGKELCS